LTIISPYLPRSIDVIPSFPEPNAYVTVADVLSTLHRALRLTVTPDQFKLLPSREVQRMVNVAYESRISNRRIFEGKDTGVKMVDCLMGRNRFAGLSGGAPFGPGTWALNIS